MGGDARGRTAGTSGRVRLEPLSAEHVPALEALARDPDVERQTYVPSRPAADFASGWVEHYERGRADGTCEGFAIVAAQDGSFLGFAAAVRLDDEASEAELGYIVAPEARGRGVATEALRLLTAWCFARGLQRLELRVDAANQPSHHVARRCGYSREGVLRSVHFKEGNRRDMVVYSRLPGDEP